MPRRKRQPTAINYLVTPGTSWWAYARHSPGPGQDIVSQKQAIAEFAAHSGIVISRWFVDEAESGSSIDRDQFAAMIEASGILHPVPPPPAAAGILVLNFSRLGRDQQMSQFLISGFRLRGWLVVPIQEGESLPEGQFAAIFESLTHWKDLQRLEEITRDTKRGLRRVVTQQITLPMDRS
jgi:DNA invertase Pin-like site-specific DNA recombinase